MTEETRPVSAIICRDDLYPRLSKDAETVQKYAADLEVMPPIEINQHNELIDGWHRWTAHKKNELDTIPVKVTVTASDAEVLELAIERNAAHGLQLSREDKQALARRIYHATPESQRTEKKEWLTKILSVSRATVYEWVSRIDKDAKEERNKRIYAKWLACWTQQEIAGSEGISVGNVNGIFSEFPELEKLKKSEQTLAIVQRHVGPDREGLALRCEQAARFMAGQSVPA